jgi:hypothetical protein
MGYRPNIDGKLTAPRQGREHQDFCLQSRSGGGAGPPWVLCGTPFAAASLSCRHAEVWVPILAHTAMSRSGLEPVTGGRGRTSSKLYTLAFQQRPGFRVSSWGYVA